MADSTLIAWTDRTFNPWIGCTKVSPACDGCYAEAMMGMAGRYKRVEWGAPGQGEGTRVRTVPSTWAKVRKWDRDAAKTIEAWRTNPFARPETPKPTTSLRVATGREWPRAPLLAAILLELERRYDAWQRLHANR